MCVHVLHTIEKVQGSGFISLLTVSKESALTKAGNSVVSQVNRIFACVRAYSTLLRILRLHNYCCSTEILRLHSKQRMVIVSVEFEG